MLEPLDPPQQTLLPQVPDALQPVVTDLHARRVRIVTLADLEAYGTLVPPPQAAEILVAAHKLWRTGVDGAWEVAWYSSKGDTGNFTALAAYLALHPSFPAAVAAKSVAQAHRWLYRPTRPTIGVGAGVTLPVELSQYNVVRWTPRIGVDYVGRVPVWRPATVVAYGATHATRMVWGDVAEWLHLLCSQTVEDELIAELEDAPRSAWMAAAYIMCRGEQSDKARHVKCAAPPASGDPDHGTPRRPSRAASQPRPSFELVDHVIAAQWSELPARLRAANEASHRKHPTEIVPALYVDDA